MQTTLTPRPGLFHRLLGIFGDVRPGEGGTVLLMSLNIFLLLVAYYVLKTVREPLILMAGGAQLKSYAAAAQALTLIVYVPLYGWAASKLPRQQVSDGRDPLLCGMYPALLSRPSGRDAISRLHIFSFGSGSLVSRRSPSSGPMRTRSTRALMVIGSFR